MVRASQALGPLLVGRAGKGGWGSRDVLSACARRYYTQFFFNAAQCPVRAQYLPFHQARQRIPLPLPLGGQGRRGQRRCSSSLHRIHIETLRAPAAFGRPDTYTAGNSLDRHVVQPQEHLFRPLPFAHSTRHPWSHPRALPPQGNASVGRLIDGARNGGG